MRPLFEATKESLGDISGFCSGVNGAGAVWADGCVADDSLSACGDDEIDKSIAVKTCVGHHGGGTE
jgi:hypothetical protein